MRRRVRHSLAIVGLAVLVAWGAKSSSPTSPSTSTTPATQTFTLTGNVSESAPTTANRIPGAAFTIIDGQYANRSVQADDGAGGYQIDGLSGNMKVRERLRSDGGRRCDDSGADAEFPPAPRVSDAGQSGSRMKSMAGVRAVLIFIQPPHFPASSIQFPHTMRAG